MVEADEREPLDASGAGDAAIRGGTLRIAGYAVGSLVSLVSVAVLLRHLGPDDGGRFVTAQAIAALGIGITDGGLAGIAVREYSVLRGEARERAMRALLAVRMLLGGIGIVGATAFTALAGYGSTMVIGVVLAGFALLFNGLQNGFNTPLTAKLQMGWVAGADLLRQVLAGVIVVALVIAGSGFLGFFSANLVAGLAAMILVMVIVRGTIPLRPSLDVAAWKGMLADTLPYAAATAVAAVYFRLAIVVVSLVTSEQQTGYFGASFRGVEVLLVVPQLLVGAAFPIFARAAANDHARLSYAIGRVFDSMVILGVATALGLCVGAEFVIRVVAGPDFAPAADVLRWHGLSLLASFIGAPWAYAALSLRRHGDVLRSTIAALAVSAVLVPILATTHDAVGAAAGTAVAEAVLAAGMAFSVRRAGVPLSPNLSALVRVVLSAVVSLWPLLLGVSSLVAAVLALVTYAVLLLVLRAIPAELMVLLRRERRVV
jgi:O-antigen/teichoic acid export membrane protein